MHPILLKIGPFTLYSYGFCVAMAFLVCSVLVVREASTQGLRKADVLDVLIAVLLGGLIGGRLLFVFINLDYYLVNPIHILFLNEGGMAFQGGLAGGVAGAYLACRSKKISLLLMLDIVAPYAALGHALGRIGCFLNGCCYGKPAEKGLAVTFPAEGVARVPVQIYESLALVVLFFVLKAVSAKKTFAGEVFSAYIVFYAALRFLMEGLRGDNPVVLWGITLPQLICAVMLAVGALMWAWLRGKRRQ